LAQECVNRPARRAADGECPGCEPPEPPVGFGRYCTRNDPGSKDSAQVLDYRTLSEIDLFESLAPEQLRELAEQSSVTRIEARKMFKPSESEGPVCVLHGSLKTIRKRGAGRPMIVNFLGPGDVFNIFAVPKNDVRYQALEETLVVRMGRDAFAAAVLGERWQMIAPGLERIMAQIFKTLDHYNSLFGQPLRFRLARELLSLSERFGTPDEEGGILIRLAITNSDLAAFIGCSPRQLDVLLGEFQKEGMVRRDGRRLIVVRGRLQDIVDEH
jgi:CRP-like cAMP-binding protein